ncbi:hypothetical protein CALVIDRAFT_569759 [Calocera viscosa TUFC12733]|uniref:Uncharacterized protein n=1 Tax=Calocera viscosa (strain TUFC12733) TaxID=1330018 RepID=A0A167FLP4_CALVF|nr:hypothetical protein CALVIDRAFT_569759 [Calocera viscosa TUFC12733]
MGDGPTDENAHALIIVLWNGVAETGGSFEPGTKKQFILSGLPSTRDRRWPFLVSHYTAYNVILNYELTVRNFVLPRSHESYTDVHRRLAAYEAKRILEKNGELYGADALREQTRPMTGRSAERMRESVDDLNGGAERAQDQTRPMGGNAVWETFTVNRWFAEGAQKTHYERATLRGTSGG